MNQEALLGIIKHGESEHVEYKRSVSKKINQEIVAFTNADGGYLIIGIDDNGTIIGTEIQAAKETITSQIQAIVPPPFFGSPFYSVGRLNIKPPNRR